MTYEIHIGDTVEWNWGEHTASGTVKGTEVTRDASDDEPAYLIEQDEGDEVLKSAGELNAERSA